MAAVRPERLSCALAIGGVDPSGGAGLAADLRAFVAAGAWGCAAAAVVTVQSTAGLRRTLPVGAADLTAQVREVIAHQPVRAIKTGALGSADNVRAVVAIARARRHVPLVVDPVLAPTRGVDRLIASDALSSLRALCSIADLVTPNAREAGILIGARVRDTADAERAARMLVALGARAALVKGGHLAGGAAVDVLATARRVVRLRTPRRPGVRLHGAGCTLASLVAGRLAARGGSFAEERIEEAVAWAKRRLWAAIQRAARAGDGLLVIRP